MDSTVITSADFKGVLDALASQISVSTVVEVLVVLVGASAGLIFMWWGVKKLTRALMNALYNRFRV